MLYIDRTFLFLLRRRVASAAKRMDGQSYPRRLGPLPKNASITDRHQTADAPSSLRRKKNFNWWIRPLKLTEFFWVSLSLSFSLILPLFLSNSLYQSISHTPSLSLIPSLSFFIINFWITIIASYEIFTNNIIVLRISACIRKWQ